MIKYKNYYFGILILITTIVFCTPILCNSINNLFVVVFLWIYIIINFNHLTRHVNARLTFWVITFIIVIFAYRFLGISDAAWGNYLNQLCFYSCILFMPFFQKELRQSKLLLWMILGLFFFNVVDNIILGYLYPSIHTNLKYVDEDFLATINAGGPSFYMLVLFTFNICYFVLLNSQRKSLRLLMLISCILFAIFILGVCFKGITVLFFLLSVIIIYYAKHTKNISSFISFCVVFLLITFSVVLIFSDEMIQLVKAVSPNERLTMRLVTLIDDKDVDANTYTVTGRTDLYLLSIETWLSDVRNFLIGIGYHIVSYGAAKTGISQHSDLLDILACYGLLGLSFIYTIFKRAFKIIISYFDNEYKLQVSSILMLFVLYGTVEKIFRPMAAVVIFILLPLSAGLVNKKI